MNLQTMFNNLRTYISLWVMLLLTSAAFAQQKNDSIRILYIGNSYTYYHDLPKMVQSIAANVALDYRMKIAYQAYTPGGCTFKRHLQQPEEIAANTIFATFFQKPYQTTFTAGLDAELAEYVQQTVQQIVLGNRKLLNLPFPEKEAL